MANPLTRGFVNALTGKAAHVSPLAALEGLSVAQARRRPVKRLATIWEQLAHGGRVASHASCRPLARRVSEARQEVREGARGRRAHRRGKDPDRRGETRVAEDLRRDPAHARGPQLLPPRPDRDSPAGRRGKTGGSPSHVR